MPYVAPSTVSTLQTYGSAAHNIIVNDVIDHESRINTVVNTQYPYRNVLVNGDMQIAQRGTSVSGLTASTTYPTADRWQYNVSAMGTWTHAVSADAPTGSGFRNSIRVTCTTALTSLAALSEMEIVQKLEGQTLQHIKKGTSSAQQLTLSFWVKGNKTGASNTYIVELKDEDNSRSVSASYTISANDTWEQKTVTFPADTTGVFDNDNAASLSLLFWLGAGTTFSSGTLATTWGTLTNANRAVGQTNLASAVSNYLAITGVQLEPGAVASPFEFVRYDDSLRRCQRYYFRVTSTALGTWFGTGFVDGAGNGFAGATFPVPMRTTPTTIDTTTVAADYAMRTALGAAAVCTAVPSVLTNGSTTGVVLATTVAGGLTAGQAFALRSQSANVYIGYIAEL